MSRTSAVPTVAGSATTHAEADDTLLHGRTLLLARGGYLALTATVVALNLVALPDIAASQLTPDELQILRQARFSPTLYAAIGVASYVVILLVCLALSLVVFWRRSQERMALFCAAMLVVFGGAAASPLDDVTGGAPMPEPLASIGVLRTVVHLLVVIGQVSFVVFFYVFPSGHFVPRWTRWVALLALAYWFTAVFNLAQISSQQGNLILVFWVVAVVAQVYRYRRVSTPREREQTKWIVFGLAVAVVIVLVPSLIQALVPSVATSLYTSQGIIGNLIFSNTWVVAVLIIPIVIAIAILRAHLWDIDILINRALVYGSLTLLLALVYFSSIVGAQQLVRLVTGRQAGQNPLVIVLSTLLIAALVTPLRRRIQTTIDRRFYRSRYDAAKTLERFAATLRSETDLTHLRDELVGVVEQTMQPAHISLWLAQTRQRDRLAGGISGGQG